MEHRYHARMDADIPMLIYRCGIPVATGRIRDASRGGIFVDTGYGELRPNQQLEVEFPVSESGDCVMRRVRAHVRRCEEGGMALEVDDRDSMVVPSMRALLRQLLDEGGALANAGGPALRTAPASKSSTSMEI